MDVKDILTRCQEVSGDIKETTAQTESDGNNDVPVKKEVDNTHQIEYNVVTDGGMSMHMGFKDVQLEQTVCEHKMEMMADVSDTGRPHPVLLVQVKRDLDVHGVCPQHGTIVHGDRTLPGCGTACAEESKNTCNRDVSVKQEVDNTHHLYNDVTDDTIEMSIKVEVNDVKHESTANMECASNLSPGVNIQDAHTPYPVLLDIHTPYPVLLAKVKEEMGEVLKVRLLYVVVDCITVKPA
jgi:hypothetical protein